MRYVKKMLMLGILVCMPLVAFGQQAGAPQAPSPAQQQPEYVEEKGFKVRVFQLQHRLPTDLRDVLMALGSGFRGATSSYNNNLRTITVRDFPENIAAMEEAIKRLDVSEPVRSDIEFRLYILLASNAEGADGTYPPEIESAVKQLKSTFAYKSYSLLTPIYHRISPTRNLYEGDGIAQVKAPDNNNPLPAQFMYRLQNISLNHASSGSVISVGNLYLRLNIPSRGQASINSSITIRENEKVVVGTSSLQDQALILIVTANPVK